MCVYHRRVFSVDAEAALRPINTGAGELRGGERPGDMRSAVRGLRRRDQGTGERGNAARRHGGI